MISNQYDVRWRMFSIIACCVLTLAFFPSALFSHEADGANVLLILSDDHSVPHVGCYESENCQRFSITPNLEPLPSKECDLIEPTPRLHNAPRRGSPSLRVVRLFDWE